MTTVHSKPERPEYDFYQGRERPKHHTCAAALIVRDGKVLMGLREYEKGNPVWTFPGGRCDPGEDPKVGLKREVAEEIAVNDLEVIQLLGVKEGAYRDENGADQVHMFLCRTRQDPSNAEPEKFLEWRWIGPEEIPENLIDSKDAGYIRQALQ